MEGLKIPEYINPNNYTVHLPGPDGLVIRIKGHHRKVLSDYFERYCQRGFIKRSEHHVKIESAARPIQAKISLNKPVHPPQVAAIKRVKRKQDLHVRKATAKARVASQKNVGITRQIVGRKADINANQLLQNNLASSTYPISNNIGVGILSFNRAHTLRRLVQSIVMTTDLRRTTVFISDDGSTDAETIAYLDELAKNPHLVVLRNKTRIGVAGNSNRLLRCLSRFAYGILLNDDVEVLQPGWDTFYPEAMRLTGMHHFIYRQKGVYNASEGDTVEHNGLTLKRVDERPHGAVLAFSNTMLQKIGYFDESYGFYGMEHVDWSQRVWEMGLQLPGFFDVARSDTHFVLHPDLSAVDNRTQLLVKARAVFSTRTAKYVPPNEASKVGEITYVIPFRNFERTKSIKTVVNNVRAQRFPVVNIIIVEQDAVTNIDLNEFGPVTYLLAPDRQPLFNKALAFNLAVSKVTTDKIVLHDADMLVLDCYTAVVAGVLDTYEACHLGKTVIYTSLLAAEAINNTGIVDTNANCERAVAYYEGGSLACTTKAFWRAGGFNQDYVGYGCEDCDFYARLSGSSNWQGERSFDLLHLWHSRVPGWDAHHAANKQLETSLKQLSIQERIALQHEQLRRLGYGHFAAASTLNAST